MRLSTLQSNFLANIITDTHTTEKEASTKRVTARKNPDLRLQIYRRNYYGNHCHALADTYARVKKTVGDGYFKSLAMEYIAKYPSTSGDLNDFGNHFPEFIKTDAMNGKVIDRLPYLADLAQLEWYTLLSLRAPKKETPLAQLLLCPPLNLDTVRFRLNPACFILKSSFPIYDIWCLTEEEIATVNLEDERQTVCISRVQNDVSVVAINTATTLLIEQWSQGVSFGESLTHIASYNPELDIAELIRDVSSLNVIGAIM